MEQSGPVGVAGVVEHDGEMGINHFEVDALEHIATGDAQVGKSLVGEGLREEFGFQIAAHENADAFALGLRVKLAGVAGDELRLCALTVADLLTA